MLDELRSEHVMTARARGLPRTIIVRHHVLRNALVPILTVAGVQLASLIAGTIVVEQVFGLNGLGQLLVSSVNQKDLPVVQAVCLIMVAVFVITNTAVDVLYSTLDPRIRRVTGAR
jgi:peptide/nickel transport system permease protein